VALAVKGSDPTIPRRVRRSAQQPMPTVQRSLRAHSPLRSMPRAASIALALAAIVIVAAVLVRAVAGRASTGPAASSRAPTIVAPRGFVRIARYTTIVKNDSFNGAALPAGWAKGRDDNHGFAATVFQPSQVSLTGSSVALTAINQASGGYPYQSGWISTEGSFSTNYGLIDFRAKMPAGQGLWSGLWLNQPDHSNPWGEIDVQEMLLGNTHAVYGSLHGWAPDPSWGELQGTALAADASQRFHDYQVVWQPGMITWAVDGVAYAQYTRAQAVAAGHPWPFDDGAGLFLIADLAVAAPAEWGGAPNSSTVFPASMQIQSVRVWR
jgi:beta-glucanase (GH16 family)